jgi:hypothetical protein
MQKSSWIASLHHPPKWGVKRIGKGEGRTCVGGRRGIIDNDVVKENRVGRGTNAVWTVEGRGDGPYSHQQPARAVGPEKRV